MDQSLIYKKEVFNFFDTTVVVKTTGWIMHGRECEGENEVLLKGDFCEEFLYFNDGTEVTNLRCIRTEQILKSHVKNS